MPGMAVFRADASARMGTGHVMRCLAIAQAWQDAGGCAAFISHALMPPVEARLRSEKAEVFPLACQPGSGDDALETRRIASSLSAAWLFVDGYHFGPHYLKQLPSAVIPLALVDDFGDRGQCDAELVVNPNIFAQSGMYREHFAAEKLLTGLKYALVRREFRAQRPHEIIPPDVAHKVLITLGGSDPDNVTLHLLNCMKLVDVADLEITVVSGAASPHHEALRAELQSFPRHARLLIDVHDMPGALRSADVVISAAGSSCAEAAVLGVPMMLVTIAENHASNAEAYASQQLALSLGWCARDGEAAIASKIQSFIRDPELRRKLAQNAYDRIDGKGAARIADAMKRHTLTAPTKLGVL